MTRLILTEKAFQAQVIDLARATGWRVHHQRPAMTSKGWRSTITGDKGFFDLVLAHSAQHRLILAECKSADGDTSPDQDIWLDILRGVPGVEVYLWRPDDFEAIVQILQGREA